MLRKKSSNLETIIKQTKYRSSFKLCLYLHQFLSVSLVKQGSYFITATMCPRNAVLRGPPLPSNKQNWIKSFKSRLFHVKYNNHIQNLNQVTEFSFCLQETFQSTSKTNKNKLYIVFQLHKTKNEAEFDEQTKRVEQYEDVAQFTFQIVAHEQISFVEFWNARFELPYAAELSGVAVCLLTDFEVIDQRKLLQSEKQMLQSQRKQKVSNYFDLMGTLKKLNKKHRFNSFSAQKSIEDVFLGFKSLMSIPNRTLSPVKSLNEGTSMLTQIELELDRSLFTLQKQTSKKETSSVSNSPQKFKSSSHSRGSNSSCADYKLEQFNEKQCSEEQFLKYLAFIEYQDHRLHQLIKQINNIGQRNQQVIEELMDCLMLEDPRDSPSISYKVHIDSLFDEYQKKKRILYSQKTIFFQKYNPSSHVQIQLYTKALSGLKQKQKETNYFTKMSQIFNLTPAADFELDILKFDKCPYLIFSHQEIENSSKPNPDLQNSCFFDLKSTAEEEYSKRDDSSSENQTKNQHRNVFILAHGYQATSVNMEKLKISLKRMFSKSKFLILKSFSQHMDQPLQQMGKKAATQIETFINQIFQNSSRHLRIIFLGHSMGGLILRSSLQYLPQKIISYLHTFISLATPHLGYLNIQSFLTNAGIKLIESMHPSTSLKQLSNKDKNNIKDTFIYKLASIGSLKHFQNVLLFASLEDKYVPWNSARIQLHKCPEGIGGKNTSGGWAMQSQKHYFRFVQQEMINQLLPPGTKIKNVFRFEVDFNINHVNLDTMIGRTSHVAFLGNEHIFPMVFEGCLSKGLYKELGE